MKSFSNDPLKIVSVLFLYYEDYDIWLFVISIFIFNLGINHIS